MNWVDDIEAKLKAATRQEKLPTLSELEADMELYRKSKEYFARLIAALRVAEHKLDYIANSYSVTDLEFRAHEFREDAAYTLDILRKGEFGGDAA